MWFDAYGEIPKGMQVHHKDHNAFNNSLDNFELVDRSEHARAHAKDRLKKDPEHLKKFHAKGIIAAAQWHGSPEGIEWHKAHSKRFEFGKFNFGNKNCEQCGKEFIVKQAGARFCHNNCKSAHRRANNPDLVKRKCEQCNQEFETFKYNQRRFCTRKCRPAPNPYGSKGRQNDLQRKTEGL
jgi:hypothetical protein